MARISEHRVRIAAPRDRFASDRGRTLADKVSRAMSPIHGDTVEMGTGNKTASPSPQQKQTPLTVP